MLRTPVRAILVSALLVLAGALGHAPGARQPRRRAAPAAMAGQKAAFLALPEATRKAAQDALVWLGFYNGAADGDFGKRTRNAITAPLRRAQKRPPTARCRRTRSRHSQPPRRTRATRSASAFLNDPKTRREDRRARRNCSLRTRGAKLEFASSADPDLSALYARLSAGTPTRKVAYKAMKPDDFFVICRPGGLRSFIRASRRTRRRTRRSAASPSPIPPLRPPGLDRVAIAIANSFEAFPTPGRPAKAPGASAAAAPAALGSSPVPPAASPEPSATALIVAPGEALTALKAEGLSEPDRRRQARPVRAQGPRDRPRDDRRRLRFEGRSSALWRAGAGSGRSRFRRTARGGELRFARGRRSASRSLSLRSNRARAADPCSIAAARWVTSLRRSSPSPSASPASRSPPRTPSLHRTPSAPSSAPANPPPRTQGCSAPAPSPRARRTRSWRSIARRAHPSDEARRRLGVAQVEALSGSILVATSAAYFACVIVVAGLG